MQAAHARHRPWDHRSWSRIAAAAVLCLIVGCSRAPHDEHAGHDHEPQPESPEAAASRERAVEITTKMLEAYQRADSYTDHAAYIEESALRGEGIAHELPYYQIAVALKRPNLLRLTFTEALADKAGKRRGFDVACDGDLLRATLAEIPDQIVENPAPAEFTAQNVLADPLIHELLLERALGDVLPQVAMLLNTGDDDDSAVFAQDFNPRMLDDAPLGDRTCYRVATSHPEGTRVLWIDRDTYALRRMELPIEAHRQRIDPDGHYLRLAVRIDFNDVTFGAVIDPKSFVMAPAPGVRRVQRFVLPESEESTAKDAMDAKQEVKEEVKEETDQAEGETGD